MGGSGPTSILAFFSTDSRVGNSRAAITGGSPALIVHEVQVADIASVKEEVDEDGDRTYHLRFRDRSRLWTGGLADFDDFLTRIEAMNPSIEIKRHKSRRVAHASGDNPARWH